MLAVMSLNVHGILRIQYQFLELNRKEQNTPVEGFDVTNKAASALILKQFESHPQTVNLGTERNCILIDASISTPYGNVVGSQRHTVSTKNQQVFDYIR